MSHVDRSLVRGSGRLFAFLGGVGIFVAVNAGIYGVWAFWHGAGIGAVIPIAISVGGSLVYQWAAYISLKPGRRGEPD